MSSYRSHSITVDDIESVHEPYCQAGPHTVRQIFDIVDDELIHKATYHYLADFEVDEEYYLKSGFVRDVRTQEMYAMATDKMDESWINSVATARQSYKSWMRSQMSAKRKNKRKAKTRA